VNAVVHNHSPSIIPFGLTKVPLRAIFHMAAFIGNDVPIFEIRNYQPSGNLLVRNNELGAGLATVLGSGPIALMRGHGSVVVGPTLPIAIGRSIFMEQSANLQMQAMLIAGPGGEVNYLDGAEIEFTGPGQNFTRAWHLWRKRTNAAMRSENTAS
jgi:ribulose-5-phosphate 4-epimerase/fuculose-1-phosphate aldolase